MIYDRSPATADRYARVRRLCAVVRALLDQLPAVALLWEPAQRLINPRWFTGLLAHGAGVVDYAVNLQLFRIAGGRPGEMLMDTLGLVPLGLPDLQCHFAGARPGRIGAGLGRIRGVRVRQGRCSQQQPRPRNRIPPGMAVLSPGVARPAG